MSAVAPNVTTSSQGQSKQFAQSIGNGLVEITSLTALIGSSTAEKITLGNRGAPGLAWAGMSMFGCLSILRACLAASMPDWLRDTFGMRTATTDNALGFSLNLASKYADREDLTRKNLPDAVGVVCIRRDQVRV